MFVLEKSRYSNSFYVFIDDELVDQIYYSDVNELTEKLTKYYSNQLFSNEIEE